MKKTACFCVIICMIVTLFPVIGMGAAKKDAPEFTWRMQVIHSVAQSDYKQNMTTANEIFTASNGRMKIEVSPNGTFSPSLEAFQACGDGVFEMHSSWPFYAKGIEYAFLPITACNMTMDAHDMYVWIYEYNGWDIIQEAFDKLNLKLLAVEIWGTEILMSNKPYKSLKEMAGKKMRTSDPRLIAKHNIAGITLPLEEVFTGLQTGTVDMAEFGNLKYNEGLGLTDITKYGIWPDFWNVRGVTTVVVNKDAWKKLPPDLQKIVEFGFKAREFQHWTKSQWESAQTMKKLEESGKMQFLRIPSQDMVAMRKETYGIEQDDIKKYKGLTAKVYNSFYDFMKTWYPYKYKAAWWGWGLTPDQQIGAPVTKKK